MLTTVSHITNYRLHTFEEYRMISKLFEQNPSSGQGLVRFVRERSFMFEIQYLYHIDYSATEQALERNLHHVMSITKLRTVYGFVEHVTDFRHMIFRAAQSIGFPPYRLFDT